MGSETIEIPGFKIIRKIGEGGMGKIFLAHQVRLDRDIALKLLGDSVKNDTSFVARFLREAQAAAKLNHPNIVQTYDAGKYGDDYYLAMEFVEGESLASVLSRDGALDALHAQALMRELLSALAHAHSHGIIHRDIKPDNIFLTNNGHLKLGDFGLAKRIDTTQEMNLTSVGMAVGTPLYMSPEQIRGAGDLDERADLYSAGATFYHMLTGRFPFKRESQAELLSAHLVDAPQPPSEINPALSNEISDLVLNLMAKKPEDRYPDCKTVLQNLDHISGQEPSAIAGAASLKLAPSEISEAQSRAVSSAYHSDPDSKTILEKSDVVLKAAEATEAAEDATESQATHAPDVPDFENLALANEGTCPYCGGDLALTATTCPHCAKRVGTDTEAQADSGPVRVRWFGGPVIFALASVLCVLFFRQWTRWIILAATAGVVVMAFMKKGIGKSQYGKIWQTVRGELKTAHDWIMAILGLANLLASVSQGPLAMYLCGAIGAGIVAPIGWVAIKGGSARALRKRRARQGAPSKMDLPKKEKLKPGDWYVLTSEGESQGLALSVLLKWIKQGRLVDNSSIKGPTTNNAWRFADETPMLSRHFGVCWRCGAEVGKKAARCPECAVDLDRFIPEMEFSKWPVPNKGRKKALVILVLIMVAGVVIWKVGGSILPPSLSKKIYNNLMPEKARQINDKAEKIRNLIDNRQYQEAGREMDEVRESAQYKYTPDRLRLDRLAKEIEIKEKAWRHVETGTNYMMNNLNARARSEFEAALEILSDDFPDERASVQRLMDELSE